MNRRSLVVLSLVVGFAGGEAAAATVLLTIKMPAVAGLISNTATVTATENDATPANNSASAPTTVTGGAPPAGVPMLPAWMLPLLGLFLGGVALVRTR